MMKHATEGKRRQEMLLMLSIKRDKERFGFKNGGGGEATNETERNEMLVDGKYKGNKICLKKI
jgi:hypothetical protein